MRVTTSSVFVVAAAVLSSSTGVLANPEPRPPGPHLPPDMNKLADPSLSPKEALDVNAYSVDRVVSSLLGPHEAPVVPDPATSKDGTIKLTGPNTDAWLGDGSLDGDAVWAPVFEQAAAAKFRVPSLTCNDLPPLFSVYGVLSPYGPIPYVGISTFTGVPDAPTTLGANSGGYGFVAPVNLTNPKTFAMSLSSMGAPYGAESAVWSLNCKTRQLTASWTAADGSQVPLTFVAWSEDGLVATGNYDLWKKANPDTGGSPLTLTFVPRNSGSKTWFYPPHKQAVAATPDKVVVPKPAVIKPVTPVANSNNNKTTTTSNQKPAAVPAAPVKAPVAPAVAAPVAQKSATIVPVPAAHSKMARLVKR
ncbi:hypothetical protein OIV83_003969 [Microbotryomycetes sp. JL201]|nr:hypothetical protein OIV83_003969 [Microbotryomycetes sp. JL201]